MYLFQPDMKKKADRKTARFVAFVVSLSLIFGAVVARIAGGQTESPNPSSYRLIGTVDYGGVSGAVLDDTTGAQTFYRLREKLPDGSQIVKVKSDSIALKRPDGSLVELYIIHDLKPSASARPGIGTPPPAPVSPSMPSPAVTPVVRPPRRGPLLNRP